MTSIVELLPLLVIALMLIAAQGGDIHSIEIAINGDRTVTAVADVLIVGGGTATVPANERVTGSVYVIGGDVVIDGEIDGDVVQLAGNLSVTERATITGKLQRLAGEQVVADGASIGRRTNPTAVIVPSSPIEQAVFLAVEILVLGGTGWALARRNPLLLRNVSDSITTHSLISGTVGVLASATGLALIGFMALTVLLLPVSILGLVFGGVMIGYVYVVFGYVVGCRLPIKRVDRATVAGVLVFVVATEILEWIPLVGAVVQLAVILTGIGALLITYFGLKEFEPVELPA